MAEYIDVKDAIPMPGLRVVLTPGVPGPWSEAAKAILHVKKLKYVKARQEILGPNVEMKAWSGQLTAPVVAWNDERPRSIWIDQLALFERLAPEPRLIPKDFDERVLMYGLSNEIMGENGYIWHRRHIMVRDFTKPPHDEQVRGIFAALGQKYDYTPEAGIAASDYCATICNKLAARLDSQKAKGSRYFLGNSLTALDLYWACAAATLVPLAEEDCAMGALFRQVYTNTDEKLKAATAPILLEHRDYIYRTYLELPVDL